MSLTGTCIHGHSELIGCPICDSAEINKFKYKEKGTAKMKKFNSLEEISEHFQELSDKCSNVSKGLLKIGEEYEGQREGVLDEIQAYDYCKHILDRYIEDCKDE